MIISAGLLWPASAGADAFQYTAQTRVINACILVSHAEEVIRNGTDYGPENPDPFVFYVLENRSDLKPLGFHFVNPLAPPVITPAIYQRWLKRVITGPDPAFGPNSPFQIGAPVTPNMGAYWEVNLDQVTAQQLKQFNLIFIHSHVANATFTPQEREKLRKYVDGGGTLWVEDCGGFTINPAAPLLFDFQFHQGAGPRDAQIASPHHPLVNDPYHISNIQAQFLGDKGVGGYYVYDADNPAQPGTVLAAPGNMPAPRILTPIIWNTLGTSNPANWRPYVAAGQYGSGRVVISSQDSGCAINDYVGGVNDGYGGNSGTISGNNLLAAHVNDLEFAYNIAAWSTANQTASVNDRRTGNNPENIAAALTQNFTTNTAGAMKTGSAVAYKGIIFSVDGNLVLHAYNEHPGLDLDNDGNPDEGLPDYIYGTSYDEIWRLDLKQFGSPTGASTPTVIDFYDPNYVSQFGPSVTVGGGVNLINSDNRSLVLVMLSNGIMVAARAFPETTNANGQAVLAPVTNVDWTAQIGDNYNIPNDSSVLGHFPIPSPAFMDGVVFEGVNTSTGGKIVAIDPRMGLSAFQPSANGYTGAAASTDEVPQSTAGMTEVLTTPTVGYVTDQASNADDEMVYFGTAPLYAGGVQTAPASIRAMWFGTRSEPLTPVAGQTLTYKSRSPVPWFIYGGSGSNDNPNLRPRVFVMRPDGTTEELVYNVDYQLNWVTGIGQEVIVNAGHPTNGPVTAVDTLYADYTLDWTIVPPTTTPIVNARSVFPLPDPQNAGALMNPTIALSRGDSLVYSVNNGSPSYTPARGSVYSVNEQLYTPPSQGTTVNWRYQMTNGFSFTVNGTSVTVPPRLRNLDLSVGAGAMGGYVTNLEFGGGVAEANGVVYAVGNGAIGNLPVSVLCAFNANPDAVIHLGAPVGNNVRVRIRQINLDASDLSGIPPRIIWSDMTPRQYTLDRGSGTIRILSFAPIGGTLNAFNAGAPFVVEIGAGNNEVIAKRIVDPDGTARLVGPDGVDNLLWYAIIPSTPPAALSGRLPSGLISAAPYVQGNVVWLGFDSGQIASFDANPTSTDPSIGVGGQAMLLKHLRWVSPTIPGLTAPVLTPPAGQESTLVINTASGLTSYLNATTVVADQNRIVAVDSGSNPIWSVDSTRSFSVAGGNLPVYLGTPGTITGSGTGELVTQKIAINHPSVVRVLGSNDYLVVDSGNNRVLDMDSAGQVRWEINQFYDNYKGLLRPGDPLTLNDPHDASYWEDTNPALSLSIPYGGDTYTYSGPAVIYHYLIADTGNYRIVEIVDMYTPNGQPIVPTDASGNPAPFTMLRQLNFVSGTLAQQGQKLRYVSAQRIVVQNGALPPDMQIPGGPTLPRYLTIAAVSNVREVGQGAIGQNTAGETSAATGGSLVVLDETGTPKRIISNLLLPSGQYQRINGPTSFSEFTELDPNTNQQIIRFLLSDANGVYQMQAGTTPNTFQVVWTLSDADYYNMTGQRLMASSVQRLNTGAVDPNAGGILIHDMLITNSYVGPDNIVGLFGVTSNVPVNGQCQGEVFQLRASDYNPNAANDGYLPDFINNGGVLEANPLASITWRSPAEYIPVPGVDPPGPVRRYMGDPSQGTNTYPLEQPAFAVRPF